MPSAAPQHAWVLSTVVPAIAAASTGNARWSQGRDRSSTGQATLIIAVKDAPKIKDGGTITRLLLTISEVSVQKAAPNQTIAQSDEEVSATESEETDTAGWITVMNEPQTVDLLQFVNVSKVLGQKTLDAGTYTQIRLKIDSGTITVDGTDYPLTVPSGVLKLNRGFVLVPNETRMLTLDFNAEKSVVRYRIGQVYAETGHRGALGAGIAVPS